MEKYPMDYVNSPRYLTKELRLILVQGGHHNKHNKNYINIERAINLITQQHEYIKLLEDKLTKYNILTNKD